MSLQAKKTNTPLTPEAGRLALSPNTAGEWESVDQLGNKIPMATRYVKEYLVGDWPVCSYSSLQALATAEGANWTIRDNINVRILGYATIGTVDLKTAGIDVNLHVYVQPGSRLQLGVLDLVTMSDYGKFSISGAGPTSLFVFGNTSEIRIGQLGVKTIIQDVALSYEGPPNSPYKPKFVFGKKGLFYMSNVIYDPMGSWAGFQIAISNSTIPAKGELPGYMLLNNMIPIEITLHADHVVNDLVIMGNRYITINSPSDPFVISTTARVIGNSLRLGSGVTIDPSNTTNVIY